MNRVYYNQADKRWANHPYPSTSYPKATIKSGGCGPTSAAMIVSSLKQTIYPNEMGDLFKLNGFRAATGTSGNAFNWIAKKYGLEMTKTVYIAKAVECLQRGGVVVALCSAGGLFSTGGHFIVLSEIRGNNLIVFDPYLYNGKFKNGNRKCVTVKGNEAIVSVDNFKKYCNYTLYCYEPVIKETPSKYQNGDWVEVHVPVIFTGAKQDGDVLVETAGYQYWIHESVITDNKIIARAIIAYAGGTRYLVQVFNRQFWVDEKYIAKKLD